MSNPDKTNEKLLKTTTKETNVSSVTEIQKIKSPIDLAKTTEKQLTIENIFEKYKDTIRSSTYISPISVPYKPDECCLPITGKFLHQIWGRTYLVEKKNNKLRIKPLNNFTVTDVKECTLVYNNKSGKKPHRYYVVALKMIQERLKKMLKSHITQNLMLTNFKLP